MGRNLSSGVLGFLLCALAPVVAQTQTLHGFVVDRTSTKLQGASVTVTNESTGVSRIVLTNTEGLYSVAGLQRGNYTIIIELAKYRKQTKHGVVLQKDRSLALDFKLEADPSPPVVVRRDIWNKLSEAADPSLPNSIMGFP